MTFLMKERKHKYIIRKGDDLIYDCTVTEQQVKKGVRIKVERGVRVGVGRDGVVEVGRGARVGVRRGVRVEVGRE